MTAARRATIALVGFALAACAPPDEPLARRTTREVGGRACPRDGWSPLIIPHYPYRAPTAAKDSLPQLLPVTPIHAVVLPTGEQPARVMMFGQARSSADCAAAVSEWVSFEMRTPAAVSGRPIVTPVVEVKKRPLDSLVCAGHAFLPDGTLFAAGGTEFDDVGGGLGLDYAQTYDAQRRTWTKVRPEFRGLAQGTYPVLSTLGTRRWYPTVTTIPDGKLLVTGGYENFHDSFNLSIELYDPGNAANPWRVLAEHGETPPDLHPVQYTHVWVLPDPSPRKELFMIGHPGAVRFFRVTGSGAGASRFYRPRESRRPGSLNANGSPSVLLPFKEPESASEPIPMRVLVGGGVRDDSDDGLRSLDIYDVRTERWESRIETEIARFNGSTVLLPDGNVLLVNGKSRTPALGDPKIPQLLEPNGRRLCWGTSYDRPTGADPLQRGYHSTFALLPDGRVLIGGGQRGAGRCTNERRDMRYYYPPYLFRTEPRPRFSGRVPRCIQYGQRYRVEYDNDGRPIDRVVLMGYSAMTHSVNMSARYVELRTARGDAESIDIMAPRTPWIAPPGPYHLFLVRDFPHAHWANRRLPSRSTLVYVARSCAALRARLTR